jgi:O-antigen ligase
MLTRDSIPRLPPNDAAVLGCLLTALGYHSLRAESFEAEKLGLLLLFAAVILASGRWRVRLSALGIALAGAVFAGLVATLTAISPLVSAFGTPERSQGVLSLLVGVVVCIGASRLSPAGVRLLLPLLCLVAVALCLLLLAGLFDPAALSGLARASAAGNINYLAAWLALALLLIVPLLRDRLRGGQTGRAGWALLGGAACACITFGLIVTNSRAALIGLGAAALTGFGLWCALTARRRPALIALVGCAALLLVATLQAAPLLSAFAEQDTFRVRLWDAALLLVGRLPESLHRADGTPDALAALRPLVGYGYDTLETLDSRYVHRFDDLNNQLRIDRMHNQTLDALLMTGVIGLVAALALTQTALLTALRLLGLARPVRVAWRWIVLQAASGLALGAAVTFISGHAGMGVALGLAASGVGVGLGLLFRALRRAPLSTPARPLVAGILCALVGAFVIEQFSFSTLMTQPLMAVCLGLLLRAQSGGETDDEAAIPALHGHWLIRATGLAALTMLCGSALWWWVLALMGAFGLIGWGWVRRGLPEGDVRWRQQIGRTLALWGGFALALCIGRALAAEGLDALLRNLPPDAVPLLSLCGLAFAADGVALVVGVLWVLVGRVYPTRRGWALLVGALLLYSAGVGSAVLQRRANQLAALPDPLAFHAADAAFQAAAGLAAWNTGAVHDAARLWRTNPIAANQTDSRLPNLRRRLLEQMPFSTNARYYQWIRD